MTLTDILLIVLLAAVILLIIFVVTLPKKLNTDKLRRDFDDSQSNLRREVSSTVQQSVQSMGEMLSSHQTGSMGQLEARFKTFAVENEQKLENIRNSMEKKLSYMQDDNNTKLDEMRKLVDEKLQERMTKSFQLVSERLEQVYKGLGEMQALAVGVGDLKKILSNVKTRGILGEVQLGAILEEILAPQQYGKDVCTKNGSRAFVEFAVKLPTEDENVVYMPIDSKFPGEKYGLYRDAVESNDSTKEGTAEALKQLLLSIKSSAKDIHDKYIDPPNTTEFAIMFLPFEGLYAEVVNNGMVEILQRDFKVNIAGPSTMAALLNSLQMGFKTFAIQKRSSEVWNVLGAIKTEFDKFADALAVTQQRLRQADESLDKLVGVRTKQMQRQLKNITVLSTGASESMLTQAEDE